MAKIRVYELAKELGKDNKEMETFIRGLGLEIKGVMSTLDDDQAQMVRRQLSGGRREPERRGPSSNAAPAPAQSGPAMVIRRRGLGPRPSEEDDVPTTPHPTHTPHPPHGATPPYAAQGPSHGGPGREPARGPNPAAPPLRRPAPPTQGFGPGPSAPPRQPVAPRPAPPEDRFRPESAFDAPAEPPAPVREEPVRAPVRPPEAAAERPVEAPRPAPPPAVEPTPEPPRAEIRPAPAPPAAAPTPAPPQVRPAAPPQAPVRPSAPPQAVARPAAPPVRPAAPPPPPEPKPAVGSRIQLPANTRRLPGGIAARMGDESPREGGRPESRDARGPERPSTGPSPVGQPLKPGVQTRPGPGRPGATGITGTRPLQTTGGKPVTGPQGTPVVPAGRPGEPARPAAPTAGPRGTAPAAPPAPAAARPAAPTSIETDAETGRRVVRNESGVIVGAASQRAEPKIVGFIPLANRARPQQVIITDASEEQQRGRATVRKQREERAQAQGRRRKMTVRNMRGRPGAMAPRVTTQEMSDAKKRIRVDEVIQIADLAHQMGKKATAVLRVLWGMGMRGLTLNNVIDADTAELVASEFGYTIDNVAFQEEEFIEGMDENVGETRAPVVTIMGHVDHGKTSLLDKIRKAAVAEGEAGGITQHIGAYKVSTPKGDVVFLDTPGHEAFSAMRTRGAQVTDVVVLVVAADDGIMPTTVEAIKHARDANVPIVVAINKVDKPEANPGRVKQMLMEHSLVGEEFGGETIICEVSAKTGKGIDHLLEMLALQAEILDLRATSEGRAQGVVLEARVDKGRGPIATVLVEAGTLEKGDIIVANEFSGKVRGILDDKGKALENVGPSTPVEVLGLDGVPSAGDRFNVVESEKAARQLVSHRRETRRRKESVRTGPSIQDFIQRKKTPTLKIVMRADVQGSAEALKQALLELSTEKVKVEVIFAGVGAITQTDVKTASAGEAVIIGFNTKPVGRAAPTAESEKVPIYTFNVIYDALDKTRELMLELLEPEYRERDQGEAEVRALFPIPKVGVVAGCRVIRGLVQRTSHVRVVRGGTVIHKGRIASLRVVKEDVREVREGFECGIVVDNFPEIEPGDIIQAFEMETIAPTL
jgi:translation initiation factor IF-2